MQTHGLRERERKGGKGGESERGRDFCMQQRLAFSALLFMCSSYAAGRAGRGERAVPAAIYSSCVELAQRKARGQPGNIVCLGGMGTRTGTVLLLWHTCRLECRVLQRPPLASLCASGGLPPSWPSLRLSCSLVACGPLAVLCDRGLSGCQAEAEAGAATAAA